MENNLITPWCFRDGREYILSVNVHDKPKSIGIIIVDKITAEEWSCHYDLRYIEELTQRTGNYKPFDTFISMIKTALLKSTKSVAIDLVNYADLKALKSSRNRQCFDGKGIYRINGLPGSISKSGHPEECKFRSQRESVLSDRKYIIVTYIAEFDNVHYPIPLNYSGPPDPVAMQKTIRTLQSEISLLKNKNIELLQVLEEKFKNETHRKEKKAISSNVFSSDTLNTGLSYGMSKTSNCPVSVQEDYSQSHHSEIGQMQKLLASIHRLEEKIVSERSEHLEQMGRLQVENNYLRDKINELQITEEALNMQISRLEQVVSSRSLEFQNDINNNNDINAGLGKKRSSRKSFGTIERENGVTSTYRSMFKQQRKLNVRNTNDPLNKYRKLDHSEAISNDVSDEDDKGNESNSYNGGYRLVGKNGRSVINRSRTVSPAKFDPTAYVLQKKSKQEELAKIRMAKIEAKWKEVRSGRSRSYSAKDQKPDRPSRSTSFDRVSNSSLTESSAPTSARSYHLHRQSRKSQSPPRNVEARLKERKKSILNRGRSLERRVNFRKLEKQLTTLGSPLFQKNSKKVKHTSPKIKMETKKLPREMQTKAKGITQLDHRLKDVESSLHVLQAFIDGSQPGKMH